NTLAQALEWWTAGLLVSALVLSGCASGRGRLESTASAPPAVVVPGAGWSESTHSPSPQTNPQAGPTSHAAPPPNAAPPPHAAPPSHAEPPPPALPRGQTPESAAVAISKSHPASQPGRVGGRPSGTPRLDEYDEVAGEGRGGVVGGT